MRALISVYDKAKVDILAKTLIEKGYEIISSGGTYKYLKDMGFEPLSIEDITNFPEILDGRVKTLNPRIHGGILARRDLISHMETLKIHSIETIDLICVNLYPFVEKAKEDLTFEEMIEFIDIGGPSMLRSASKNFKDVIVLSRVDQYDEFIERLNNDKLDFNYRMKLAKDVFTLTSHYDKAICNYLEERLDEKSKGDKAQLNINVLLDAFPENITLELSKVKDLRYGENPHQKGAFYRIEGSKGFMLDFEKLNGKDLGYINYKDLEAAWSIVSDFEEVACCAIKHNTPCGVALGKDSLDAYKRCFECDSISIFGGIVGINREVDRACAEEMSKIMLHIICAPSFTEEALEILRKKKNLILIKMNNKVQNNLSLVSTEGGVLIQEVDKGLFNELKVVTKKAPSEDEMKELLFAMKVVKHVKSNAIAVSHDYMAIGLGGGYVNRIDAAKYALKKSKMGAVLASDAFFPFPDVVEEAHKAGITAIIQPGGSLNDDESIKKCDEYGIAMVFTSMRHFRH